MHSMLSQVIKLFSSFASYGLPRRVSASTLVSLCDADSLLTFFGEIRTFVLVRRIKRLQEVSGLRLVSLGQSHRRPPPPFSHISQICYQSVFLNLVCNLGKGGEYRRVCES